jgi:hypothetical protein
MPEQLTNIVRFNGLVVGVATLLPHNLTAPNGRAVIPDVLLPSAAGFTVTADATNVSVTRRTAADPAAVDILATSWHTIFRAFGANNPAPGTQPDGSLTPQPFVVDPAGGGSGGIWSLDVTPVKVANYIAVENELVQCDPSGGGFQVTLPAVSAANSGLIIVIKNTTTSVNPISIVPTGADTIDGLAGTNIVSSQGSLMFASDGTAAWRII